MWNFKTDIDIWIRGVYQELSIRDPIIKISFSNSLAIGNDCKVITS